VQSVEGRGLTVVEHTRDRILDAAERLLARLGYEKTTMDDLAREAGIGKRTIYVHFPSKEEVALSTIDRIVERLKGRLRAIAVSRAASAERVRLMLLARVLFRFDSVCDYYQSIDDLFRAIRPAYMNRRARYFAEEANIFAEVLTEGRAAGELAFENPFTTAQLLLLATNFLLPSSLGTRELGERGDLEAKVSGIAELLLVGLLTPGASGSVRRRFQASRRKVVSEP
jgi:AcrR family transcriptional regulator